MDRREAGGVPGQTPAPPHLQPHFTGEEAESQRVYVASAQMACYHCEQSSPQRCGVRGSQTSPLATGFFPPCSVSDARIPTVTVSLRSLWAGAGRTFMSGELQLLLGRVFRPVHFSLLPITWALIPTSEGFCESNWAHRRKAPAWRLAHNQC